MLGQRAEGQKLIPIPMTQKFIDSIDRAYRKLGYEDRAKFIRAAVREKLELMGYPVETEDPLAPNRTQYRLNQKRTTASSLNETKKAAANYKLGARAASKLLKKPVPSSAVPPKPDAK